MRSTLSLIMMAALGILLIAGGGDAQEAKEKKAKTPSLRI